MDIKRSIIDLNHNNSMDYLARLVGRGYKNKNNVQKQKAGCWLDVLDSLHNYTRESEIVETTHTTPPHQPVLLEQVMRVLNPQTGESYLDLTAGYGGHAAAILQRTQAPDKAVLVDRDETAVNFLRNRFSKEHDISVKHADMLSAAEELKQNQQQFDLILIDAGVSSLQLDQSDRGFSFRDSGPLDMRMDQSQELTAADVVNTWDESQLTTILREYGEERHARRIASGIVAHRPYDNTADVAAVVSKYLPGSGKMKIHPATRTFQAIRIAVNSELDQLEATMPVCIDLLKSDGRIALLSFHSLEDRIFKRHLGERAGNRLDSQLKLLTKKPIRPDSSFVSNPRARSAKLRAAVKINTKNERSHHAD